ncbi:MAG TPA: hypothetical protein GXZ65_05555 [Clostridiales bacterium]|nr:hypothetical protein [Clostridiales bacterium]
MQLLGKAIMHKTFGKGTITAVSDNTVTVSFPEGEKKFLYPDAFMQFLKLRDKKVQEQVNQLLHEKNMEEEAERKQVQEMLERRHRMANLKLTLNSQAAFGMVYNKIEDVLSSWTVSTGSYLSGMSAGQPRIPHKLKPNSACLLTQCPEGVEESERKIVGAFMVKEDFFGDLCSDGIIKAHEQYRIALEEDEALRLWNYFDEKKRPKRWGNTEFKYFASTTMQKILFDIKNAITSEDRLEIAEEFYRYFCRINRLPEYRVFS